MFIGDLYQQGSDTFVLIGDLYQQGSDTFVLIGDLYQQARVGYICVYIRFVFPNTNVPCMTLSTR